MEHVVFEVGLALGLMVLAALLAAKLRFSMVPMMILAGMVVGPHMPDFGLLNFQFVQSAPLLEFMGRIGILFLLFYLGLEFSVGRLIRAGRSILGSGTAYMLINFPLGLLLGRLLGWPLMESLIIAGIIAISSSAIVAKLIVELKRSAHPETELVLGIMMFQDVFVAIYLAIVSGLVLSSGASPLQVGVTVLVAIGFMLSFILLGRRAVPWLNRILNITSDEIFLLVLCAGLFLVAGFSEAIHVAEAIGALLFGLVLAETEHRQRIEHLVLPFRDFFGAIFFFHFGLTIDPLSLGGALWFSLAAVALTLAGNILTGLVTGSRAGLSRKASVYLGVTLVSRGEFSIVLANLAEQGGLDASLQSFAALYVLVLAVLGPLLTKEARLVFNALNRVFRWQKPSPARN
ncbi:MAG TPA: cation:proton antiporter [Symbiobacteriaceae bacterium]|nr:cation:proton antiporter [Symbiobacteriaceae bacterium]